jgi:hypothetical protein
MRLIRLLVLASFCLAAITSEPLTLARVQEMSRRATTVRLPFTQEKRLAIFPEPVVSQGVMEIDRTRGAMRWEFTGRSLLILSGGKIRRWDDRGHEEAGDDPSLQALGAQMRALLTGDFSVLSDLFVVTPDPAGAPVLTMTPKRPELARYLAKIELRFRDDLSAPKELVMTAAGDDVTTYRFGDPQIDIELPAARFAGP